MGRMNSQALLFEFEFGYCSGYSGCSDYFVSFEYSDYSAL